MFLIAKETGARLGEIWSFKWHDIYFEKATVSINSPEKNSNPRQLRVSQKFLNMLRTLPQRNEYIFRYNKESSRKSIEIVFYQLRKRAAIRLEDPELQRITFMSLRHFKAFQEYRRTRDILHVRDILGHKSLKNTLIYTHLLEISKMREKKYGFESRLTICTTFLSLEQSFIKILMFLLMAASIIS